MACDDVNVDVERSSVDRYTSNPAWTYLERIHLVPTPTHEQDLVAVQLPQLGIQGGFLNTVAYMSAANMSEVYLVRRDVVKKRERRTTWGTRDSPIVPRIVPTDDVSQRTLSRPVAPFDE